MSISKFVAIVLACALMGAAPARAVEYFFDDFNDGEMTSDWTDLAREVRAKNATRYGVYGHVAIGQTDTDDATLARASKPLSITTLADTVYLSFDAINTGGHMNGSVGFKSTYVYLVNASGEGYGILAGYAKSTQTGQFEIVTTTDFGAGEPGSAGIGNQITLPDGFMALDDFSEHTFGFAWDRVNATMDMYLDGTNVNSFALSPSQNNTFKDPTQVICAPKNLHRSDYPDDGWSWAALMTADDIWFGDELNPNAPDPILAPGDSDGNLKVDIVDLTALAANWSTISVGDKNWNQADFNYDWMVDIVDLTALAANWTFGPGDAPPSAVPEPTTMALFALTALGLLRRRR